MRIVLAGFGTRGDVQPIVALAQALTARGHTCSLFVPPNIVGWVRTFGFETTSVGLDYERVAHAASTGRALDVFRLLPLLRAEVAAQAAAMEGAVAQAQVLVAASLCAAGRTLAERFRVPYVFIVFTPNIFPSREHPPPSVTKIDTPRWFNRLAWWLNDRLWQWLLRRSVNAQRLAWGLAPVRDVWFALLGHKNLVATEPSLAALPALTREVPGCAQLGAILLPEQAELSPETARFLDAGPPPVFIGFGSMGDKDPRRTAARLLEAVRLAGVRALVSRGWAGLDHHAAPEGVLFIGSEPHGKLFPRVAAVVHHGGSGTTHTAMRAGVPQLVMPHLLDQYYWAFHVRRLGIGLELRERFSLDAKAIAAALRRCVDDGALRERARVQGEAMRRDGLERAVEIIEAAAYDPIPTHSLPSG